MLAAYSELIRNPSWKEIKMVRQIIFGVFMSNYFFCQSWKKESDNVEGEGRLGEVICTTSFVMPHIITIMLNQSYIYKISLLKCVLIIKRQGGAQDGIHKIWYVSKVW